MLTASTSGQNHRVEHLRRMAELVLDRRSELKLTQEEVAYRAGVSVSTIRLIETVGRDNYRSATLSAVSEALGLPRNTLLAISRGEDPSDGAKPDRSPADDVTDRLDSLQDQVRELSEQIAALTSALDRQARQAGS